MDNYPEEFTDLQKRPNDELAGKMHFSVRMIYNYS